MIGMIVAGLEVTSQRRRDAERAEVLRRDADAIDALGVLPVGAQHRAPAAQRGDMLERLLARPQRIE